MTPNDQPTAVTDAPMRSYATNPSPSYLIMLSATYGVPVLDNQGRVWMLPGQTVRVRLPYSEVCMHMRVAGAVMLAELTDTPHPMVQLRKPDDGCPFSFPIGTGEAGIYGDRTSGFYTYPECES